jgi:tyrosyl-tRNA synthetase
VERKITNAFCPTTPQKSGADEDEMHLVTDDLKNPCLDYVKHIILSRPGATFSAGGVTYTSADDVKAKLVGGQLSEKDLKAGLVVEINKLLEPVRKHFTTDAGAKALLAEIAAYKKDPPKDPKFICCKPFAPQTTVVFAPLPTTTVRMDGVVRVLSALRRGAARGPCVLWLQDWTAFATNATNGDKNAIQAFYTLFTAALEGLDKALMARVKVEWQSAVAFAGASDYWLSVINVGRSVQVEELRKVFEADGQSLDTAGQVIGALLFGGDVLAASSAEGAQLYVDPGQAALAEFALGYVRGKTPLAPPALVPNDAQPLHLNDLANENAHLLTTDADMIVGSKLKKAFCEPGNTTFCPPLAFAHFLLGSGREIVVKRKEENGGDKTYKDLAAIKADFLSGALHPGDLKPSVTKAVVASLAGVREVYKQAAVKKAQKDLETFAKKTATKDFRTGVQAVMAMNRMRSGSGQELEPKA